MTKKLTVPVKGMHCKSCELVIEQRLLELSAVRKVSAQREGALAIVEYEGQAPSKESLVAALERAGYEYGVEKSLVLDNYYELAQAVIIALVLYLLVTWIGFDKLINDQSRMVIGPSVALVFGLVAGLSSCMSLIGGLVLSISASWAKSRRDLSGWQSLEPHWYFNLGRVLGYAALGAVLALIGESLGWLIGLSAWLVLVIGLVMVLLAIKLLDLPFLQIWEITWPKGLMKYLGLADKDQLKYSKTKTAMLGAVTFFVPCGFTQAMQIYALGSGSAFKGAMAMGLFALGTMPGLLSLGALVAMIKGSWSGVLFKLAGLTVLAFGVFNLHNAWNLLRASDFSILAQSKLSSTSESKDLSEADEQVIMMVQDSQGYSPKKFTVQSGRRVKWVIDSRTTNNCAAVIVAPNIGLNRQLVPGENIIYFTPEMAGKIIFTCSMGMYSGEIEVIQ